MIDMVLCNYMNKHGHKKIIDEKENAKQDKYLLDEDK